MTGQEIIDWIVANNLQESKVYVSSEEVEIEGRPYSQTADILYSGYIHPNTKEAYLVIDFLE